jgi:hypothetical protein
MLVAHDKVWLSALCCFSNLQAWCDQSTAFVPLKLALLTIFGEQRHLGGMVAVGNAAKLDAATPAATMPSMKIPSTNQRRVRIVLPRNLLPLKA